MGQPPVTQRFLFACLTTPLLFAGSSTPLQANDVASTKQRTCVATMSARNNNQKLRTIPSLFVFTLSRLRGYWLQAGACNLVRSFLVCQAGLLLPNSHFLLPKCSFTSSCFTTVWRKYLSSCPVRKICVVGAVYYLDNRHSLSVSKPSVHIIVFRYLATGFILSPTMSSI